MDVPSALLLSSVTGSNATPMYETRSPKRDAGSHAPDRIHLAALDGLGGRRAGASRPALLRLGSNLWFALLFGHRFESS